MKEIINELKQSLDFELHQIGMTPRTNFNGNQKEHDDLHKKKADDYEKAIKILSAKFIVRDWMVSEIHDFEDFDKANDFYKERINLCEGGETDVELCSVIECINNID